MQIPNQLHTGRAIQTAFVWLFVAAVIGLLLRYSLLYKPPFTFNYQYLLHAHSHVMFMGWMYNILFISLVSTFVSPQIKGTYVLLFYLFQLSVLGMLLSFPIQGYAAVSIAFSTLHVIADYWFAVVFFKDTRKMANCSHALQFARWGIFFMLLSALGPFGLGYAMSQQLQNTPFYQFCIYFYLHFQYNGWLIFGILALVLHQLEKKGLNLPPHRVKLFLHLMVISCMLSFSLSTLFAHPSPWVYGAGFVSGFMQLIALLVLAPIIWRHFRTIGTSDKLPHLLLILSGFAFGLKILLQIASAFPCVSDFAYANRNYIIAYLHLVFLGIGTFYFLAHFAGQGYLPLSGKIAVSGLFLLLFGFIISQTLLISQPWFNAAFLFTFATAMMPTGALLLGYGIKGNKSPNKF